MAAFSLSVTLGSLKKKSFSTSCFHSVLTMLIKLPASEKLGSLSCSLHLALVVSC